VSTEGVSSLGAHLAEMDRLLRDIQAELLPEREPRPALEYDALHERHDAPRSIAPSLVAQSALAAPPPASEQPSPPPPAERPSDPDRQIRALAEISGRLLASMRELLDGYDRVLAQTGSSPGGVPAPAPTRRPEPTARNGPGVIVSVGPFTGIEALREFEQALARLPGVSEVAVRAYEGTDRAIIDVRLDHLSPSGPRLRN
jgi:hypothetical protein